MRSSWFPLLLFLPYLASFSSPHLLNSRNQVASNCIDYGSEEKICNGSRCYARTIHHQPEGAVQRLGCLPALGENTLNCEDHLHPNKTKDICLQSGSRQVCCCLADSSSSSPCNRVWQLETVLPVISYKETFLLLLVLGVSVVLPVGLRHLLGYRLIQVSAKMRASILRFENIIFSLKSLVLLLFFIVSWTPSTKECQSQPKGLVQLKMEFLFQVVGYPFLNYPVFVLPLACFLLDAYRIYRVHEDGIPVRQFIHMGLTATFIASLCGSVIIWNYLRLTSLKTADTVCKKKAAALQLLIAASLLSLYTVLGLLMQFVAWTHRRTNEYLLLEEEQGQRDRDLDLMLDDGPGTYMETAMSATTLREEEYIAFSPRPFAVDGEGEGVLTIRNLHLTDWVAIRLLCSIPLSYSIHPQKLVLPPQREVTVSIRTTTGGRALQLDTSSKPTLMVQWFSVASSAMLMDATRLWQKPFVQPRHQWKFFVLPIFHEQ